MREGEFVDIEVDSGAEVSCLLANIGADTYPLHQTRLMCGGHHVAAVAATCMSSAPGFWVWKLVTCEASTCWCDSESWTFVKALLSTQDLSRFGSETVFPAGCGDAYLVRKASDTRITLVKKRCAWYLRVKLKPHNELPYTESEGFLEVMSMDQRAGVRLVEGGGSSGSSGPAVPEDARKASL